MKTSYKILTITIPVLTFSSAAYAVPTSSGASVSQGVINQVQQQGGTINIQGNNVTITAPNGLNLSGSINTPGNVTIGTGQGNIPHTSNGDCGGCVTTFSSMNYSTVGTVIAPITPLTQTAQQVQAITSASSEQAIALSRLAPSSGGEHTGDVYSDANAALDKLGLFGGM